MSRAEDPANPEADFRWQAWMQRSGDGVFLLNRARRLVFANRAWERATGLLLSEVRGLPCRRRSRAAVSDKGQTILGALAPPPEALQGQPVQVRRLLPAIGRDNRWVQLAFLPFQSDNSLLGILGVIKELADSVPVAVLPLPEKWLSLRDRSGLEIDAWEEDNPALARVVDQVRLAASRPGLGVWITGENGTGKLTLARVLHQLSPWKQRFFACLDCDRLPARAVADVLFPASPRPSALGVVLLKEPAHLPLDLQARIVSLLDNEEDLWLLAASRSDPDLEVRAGRLSEALFYRLGTVAIRLPTLKERRGELSWIAARMLRRLTFLLEVPPKIISPEALENLRGHDWPGNLHELSRVLLGAARRCGGERIETEHLPMYLRTRTAAPERSFNLDQILEAVERRMIELALRLTEGNKKKASDLLGIWRPRLLRRMEALKIEGAGQEE